MDFLKQTLSGEAFSPASDETATLRWNCPAQGIIAFEPVAFSDSPQSKSVVISAGIHGNETAPIEIVSELVQDFLAERRSLNVRLLVILGNLEAMRTGDRYLEVDMNRLFSGKHANYEACEETRRAQVIEQQVISFFEQQPNTQRIHFDLHTARKPSFHVRFGLLPYVESGKYQPEMIDWLRNVGLEALVINHAPAATFSYFSSQTCGAQSCTLELGKALPFGENDLSQFVGIKEGLIALTTCTSCPDNSAAEMPVYKVSQELTKLTEAFELNFAESVQNFTAFEKGSLLATDGDKEYRVEQDQEWLIFPNSGVRPGLRAGLMLTQTTLNDWIA
ncbi:succinylglutamate desuccinylase [Vibrio diazotrophicus]|uniref:Succinylglutamate desuccinylase n=1 Tax=Vibrio diazotrophicus TaxID=685 RepID=A0A2J8I5D5_VIBDI|nr:succinylglutamate desuccinylase [Vibrio diazotrophicus]PNI05735.1 succinylglutamate desuccinylase [Vibrio diazotrophicus]